MKMTFQLSLCLLFLPACSIANETAVEDQSEATSQWLRAKAFEQAETNSQSAMGRKSIAPGRVNIYSLSDYPAPNAVKQSIAQGIAIRSTGISTVAADKIPTAASVLATPKRATRSEAELGRHLTSPPSNLTKTPLAHARLVSSYFVGHRKTNGVSTGLSRVFDVPGRGVIVVDEDDYVTAGAQINLAKESLNAEVNSVPAISYATQSIDGRGEAVLSWITPRRSYRLTLLTDSSKSLPQGQKFLMDVATRIIE